LSVFRFTDCFVFNPVTIESAVAKAGKVTLAMNIEKRFPSSLRYAQKFAVAGDDLKSLPFSGGFLIPNNNS